MKEKSRQDDYKKEYEEAFDRGKKYFERWQKAQWLKLAPKAMNEDITNDLTNN